MAGKITNQDSANDAAAETKRLGMLYPSLQELHTAAGANKLPIEEFEDMSLVYSTVTKR